MNSILKLAKTQYNNPVFFVFSYLFLVFFIFCIDYLIAGKFDFIVFVLVGLCFMGLCIVEIFSRQQSKTILIKRSFFFGVVYVIILGLIYAVIHQLLALPAFYVALSGIAFAVGILGLVWGLFFGHFRDILKS